MAHTSWQIHTPDKLDVTLLRDGSNVEQLSEEESLLTLEIQRMTACGPISKRWSRS